MLMIDCMQYCEWSRRRSSSWTLTSATCKNKRWHFGVMWFPPEALALTQGKQTPSWKWKSLQIWAGCLGMVSLAEKDKPLRDLLLKKNCWLWHCQHVKTFNGLKEALVSLGVTYVWHEQRPQGVGGWPSFGLDGVLLQKWEAAWKPVAYASRSRHRQSRNMYRWRKRHWAWPGAVRGSGTSSSAYFSCWKLITIH